MFAHEKQINRKRGRSKEMEMNEETKIKQRNISSKPSTKSSDKGRNCKEDETMVERIKRY